MAYFSIHQQVRAVEAVAVDGDPALLAAVTTLRELARLADRDLKCADHFNDMKRPGEFDRLARACEGLMAL